MSPVPSHDNSSRRAFLKTSAMAALGASAAASGQTRAAQAAGNRPFVTGVKGKKLVGCYASAKEILEEPKYMDALQEQLGVNAIICRTGLNMPQWLKDMNPLKGNGWMGASPAKDDDDSQLVKAIGIFKECGADGWVTMTEEKLKALA